MENDKFNDVDKLADLFSEALLTIEKYEIKAYNVRINPETPVLKGVTSVITIQGEGKHNQKVLNELEFTPDGNGFLQYFENNFRIVLEA